jgi:hypothetical protein
VGFRSPGARASRLRLDAFDASFLGTGPGTTPGHATIAVVGACGRGAAILTMQGRNQAKGGSSRGHARAKQGEGAKLNFSFDPETDVLTIENVRYSGSLFRQLSRPDDGCLYHLIQDKDGVVIIDRKVDDGAGLEF